MLASLLDALQSPDPKLRLSAVQRLRSMEASDAVLAALVGALRDGNTEVCEAAAQALSFIGEPAVECLIGGLRAMPEGNSEDPEYPALPARANAAAAIGGIGARAKAAIPYLIDLMYDRNWSVRRVAALALAGIGPSAVSAVPALLEAYNASEDVTLREFAYEAVQKIAPDFRPGGTGRKSGRE